MSDCGAQLASLNRPRFARLPLGWMAVVFAGTCLALLVTEVYRPVSRLSLHVDTWTYAWELNHDPGSVLLRVNHLLCHVAAYVIVLLLKAVGVEQPGLLAMRIISGCSLAFVLRLLFRVAAPRIGMGVVLSACLVSTWGVCLTAIQGETVIPGVAAAALLLFEALRPTLRPRRFCLTLVLALLVRQDNLLIVPAALVGVMANAPSPSAGLRASIPMLSVAGIVTLTVYMGAWLTALASCDVSGERFAMWGAVLSGSFFEYLLGVGIISWSAAPGLSSGHLYQHGAALGRCIVGDAVFSSAGTLVIIGLLWALAIVGGSRAVARRQRSSVGTDSGTVALVVAVALASRFAFFAWFEAHNLEWHVTTVVFLCLASAYGAGGRRPALRSARRSIRPLVAITLFSIAIGIPPLTFVARVLDQRRVDPIGVERVVTEAGGRDATYVTGAYDLAVRLRARGFVVRLFRTREAMLEGVDAMLARRVPVIVAGPPSVSELARLALASSETRPLIARTIPILQGNGVAGLRFRKTSSAVPAKRYAMTDYEVFRLQYARSDGGRAVVTADDAVERIPRHDGDGVTRWRIPLVGTGRDVWVRSRTDPQRRAFSMGCRHTAGLPPGWRLEFIEQRFRIARGDTGATGERIILPKVYGPTRYPTNVPSRVNVLYPTFLQTQQLSLEHSRGDCITVICDDDRGRRKSFGFEVSSGEVTFVVRYFPDAGMTSALPADWEAPYRFRFAEGLGSLHEAIEWYRARQLERDSSFLSRRAAIRPHPVISAAKFAIAAYAVYSENRLGRERYDLSADYRRDVVSSFSALHGPGLILYHLDWHRLSGAGTPLMPESYSLAKPGHAALLATTNERPGIHSIAYTWPARMHVRSRHYHPSLARVDEHGEPVMTRHGQSSDYRQLCFLSEGFQSTWRHYWRVLRGHGFDGIYLDAGLPGESCYGRGAHGHPAGENEQLLGVQRLLRSIRAAPADEVRAVPTVFTETPVDCLHTDASGLDHYHWDPRVRNVFALTYSGAEWPTFTEVFGWHFEENRLDGMKYARDLANALVGGTRPLVLWPEIHGLVPTDPRRCEHLAEFVKMLEGYSRKWQRFWCGIMNGRRFDSLDDGSFECPWVAVSPAAAQELRRAVGHDRESMLRRGRAFAAVAHGLFERPDAPGERCLLLYRWTDPDMARRNGFPEGDPLWQSLVTVGLNLTAANMKACAGARIHLLDVATGRRSFLGVLPGSGTAPLHVRVTFEEVGAKAIVIEPSDGGRSARRP